MWIFLSDSFLSVVADKEDPKGSRLLVRARRAGDIERVFPASRGEVSHTDQADYAYRAWINRKDVAEAMSRQVLNLEYSNFKDSIQDDRYHDACLESWFAMRDLQDKESSRRSR